MPLHFWIAWCVLVFDELGARREALTAPLLLSVFSDLVQDSLANEGYQRLQFLQTSAARRPTAAKSRA
jgi:hypothetical protein